MKHRYSQQEKEWLIRESGNYKDRELLIRFNKVFQTNVGLYSLRQQRRKLGLQKVGGRGKCMLKAKTPNLMSLFMA
jgi:hypothetical protein